jgi:hypothetical protein
MIFAYPKSAHQRRETPKLYLDYRRYKPYLQREFQNHCVYCRMPDTLNNYNGFGVDHYKPQNLFRHLRNVYSNLFYACNRCNTLKDEFWQDPKDKDIFMPNPCDHVMFDHFQYKSAVVHEKSKAGKFSAGLLELNDPELIKFRAGILTAVEALEYQLSRLKKQLEEIDQLLPSLRRFDLLCLRSKSKCGR